MEKPALTDRNINSLSKKRWSPRSFQNDPVSKEKILNIFEAARWAPSSFNEQPWRFIVGEKGSKTYQMILDSLVEFNQNWASLAPVLGLAIGKKTSAKTDKPNAVYMYDVGQSVAHLTFQVQDEGLYMHQMGGFDKKKAAESFKVPSDYEVMVAFAIGYIGTPDLLPEDLAKMEKNTRERIPLKDLVFGDTFGNTSDLIK